MCCQSILLRYWGVCANLRIRKCKKCNDLKRIKYFYKFLTCKFVRTPSIINETVKNASLNVIRAQLNILAFIRQIPKIMSAPVKKSVKRINFEE